LALRVSNIVGMPDARSNAPEICTKTSSRYGTSSQSYAEANQVKAIHAHQMAKKTMRYPPRPSSGCDSAIAWCSPLAA
jgi:hypothetical protein